MPIYSFQNNDTGEVYDELMSWDARCQYLEENPHIISIITKAPGISSHKGGDRTKPPSGFKDVLSRVADANPFTPMADDFGKKDRKSVAIRDSVKRVKKKVGSIMGDKPKHL